MPGSRSRCRTCSGRPAGRSSIPYVLKSITQGCVSREFTTWALNRTSPIIDWLRALARDLHEQCGGPGVGAIGMCFTGDFALGDGRRRRDARPGPQPAVAAVRRRQGPRRAPSGSPTPTSPPSSPATTSACWPCGSPATSPCPLRDSSICARRSATVSSRSRSTAAKAIRTEFPRSAHSVVTEHLVDEPGHPTQDALNRVLSFFAERLAG